MFAGEERPSGPDDRGGPAAPLVLSASRASDIPAFHGRWLMERLREGFLTRVNPYNGRSRLVDLSRARAAVFWTKNPAPFMPYIPELLARGLAPVFQFTLNDYEAEGWEPGLPPLAERLETFRRLAEALPAGSVVWRFDPLVLGPGLSAAGLMERLEALAGHLRPHCERLTTSFLDLYPRVARRLARRGAALRSPEPAEREALARGIGRLAAGRGEKPLEVFLCAESLDYSAYGLRPGRCVDAESLARLAPDLAGRPELFFRRPAADGTQRPRKDGGQRPSCGCAPSQDIGRYASSCPHGCWYCYAVRR